MTRPRLLDLFCGAGGCSVGYHRAGFDVVGVDLHPQPNYPYWFERADALEYLRGMTVVGNGAIDAIHASPPCQMYSAALKHMSAPQPMLIEPVRELLKETGLPWVLENVEGSDLPTASTLFGDHGVMLCGTSFGLRVYRHRLFETSFAISGPPCDHRRPAMNPHNVAGRERMYSEFGRGDPEKVWLKEMGLDWMRRYEGREAIPPVFTEFIGAALMAHLSTEARASADSVPHQEREATCPAASTRSTASSPSQPSS